MSFATSWARSYQYPGVNITVCAKVYLNFSNGYGRFSHYWSKTDQGRTHSAIIEQIPKESSFSFSVGRLTPSRTISLAYNLIRMNTK